MNSVLRKIARGLKYRPLPELIGTKVTIVNVGSVPSTIGAMLNRALSIPVRFSGPQERWLTGALAKYRILDLTFIVDGVEWQPADIPGIASWNWSRPAMKRVWRLAGMRPSIPTIVW